MQEDAKTMKTKMREKVRPKMGKIDIDYQKLHDAFFKWQIKPKLTIHGDLYYEVQHPLFSEEAGDYSNYMFSQWAGQFNNLRLCFYLRVKSLKRV